MNNEISDVVKLSPMIMSKSEQLNGESPLQDSKIKQLAEGNSVFGVQANGFEQEKEQEAQSKVSVETLDKAVEEGNKLLQGIKRNLQFKVDEASQELVIKVVDSESGDVVRQIPSEEMLAFIQNMKEMEGKQGVVIQDRA